MTATIPWYVTQRSKVLAGVYLTRRDDLVLSNPPEDTGLDFLVTICQDTDRSSRLFGVQVQAKVATAEPLQNGHGIMAPLDLVADFSLRELPFPVCLFFFTLMDDRGYYKWVVEPKVEAGQLPDLCFNQARELSFLDDDSIEHIVNTVNLWYDQRSKLTAV